jgi:ATP-dependent RNA helicase DeaD
VAYTFVTTEEGGELTRIEILINRLLKRDEIEGFSAVATTVPYQAPAVSTPGTDSDGPAEPAEPAPPKKRPPGGRPRKRHRKGL